MPEGPAAGGENQGAGGLSGPPPPEVTKGQVHDLVQQGQQHREEGQGAEGGGEGPAKLCRGARVRQAGRLGQEGGDQVLPPHRHWDRLPAGGPEAGLWLLPDGLRHQGRPGQGRPQPVHQLCDDASPRLAALRDPAAEADQGDQQVLRRLRWQHRHHQGGEGEEDQADQRGAARGGRSGGRGGGAGHHQGAGGRPALDHHRRGAEGALRGPAGLGRLVSFFYEVYFFYDSIYGLAAALSGGTNTFPTGETLL